MVWKGISVKTAKALLCFTVLVAIATPGFSMLIAWAAPKPLHLQAYRYYVQGYQQGRIDAMKQQDFQPKSGSISLSSEFSKEYIRGYGDGYQLVNR